MGPEDADGGIALLGSKTIRRLETGLVISGIASVVKVGQHSFLYTGGMDLLNKNDLGAY